MAQAGVICEYNPFHDGHLRQLQWIRAQLGADTPIVCVMSGDYVQRGEPAVFSKAVRARAAVLCGASLVAELPLPAALSSAEGFARGGVAALDALGCDTLCFGSECGDAAALQAAAQVLLRPDFGPALRRELAAGVSFAAARELAAASLGADGALLRRPNDILAVEYCKALQTLGSPMAPVTLRRDGDYHAAAPSAGQPSATALRGLLASGAPLTGYVPLAAEAAYAGARRHWLRCGERAVLARLRTMDDGAFRALPFGSEGLWHRLAAACRRETSVEAIVRAVKTKRYAYARVMRMLQCACLGLTAEDLAAPAPYLRILAFDDAGRRILRAARARGAALVNAGETPPDAAYWAMERRAADWYGLYAEGDPEPGGAAAAERVFYCRRDSEKILAKPDSVWYDSWA